MIQIKTVEAVRFSNVFESGRTKPLLLDCESADGQSLEVVAKFAGVGECTTNSLCAEMIAARLGADLGLPVPTPVLVEWGNQFRDSITDRTGHQIVESSTPPAFGSTFFSGGFGQWNTGHKFENTAQCQMALTIFFFDALIGNPDRGINKPNLFIKGDKFLVFDHELCFKDFALFVKPLEPWAIGGFNGFLTQPRHIFATQLCKKVNTLDFAGLAAKWMGLSDAQIEAYETALPQKWRDGAAVPKFAIERIKKCRERIDGCVAECRRVLNDKA